MLFLALRHLLSRPRQTILTLLGVSLGTAVFIAFSAIMTGLQDYMIDRLVNNDSHVRIQAEDRFLSSQDLKVALFKNPDDIIWFRPPVGHEVSRRILNPLGWFERLNLDPRVYAYSPQLTTAVLYFHTGITEGGSLYGIRPSTQVKVSTLESDIKVGSLHSLESAARRVIIGSELGAKLGATVGDTIFVSVGGKNPAPFQISGFIETGVRGVDEAIGYANINDVQQLSGRLSEISDIVIRLYDVSKAAEFASSYSQMSQEKVLSWDQANANILSVFTLQDTIRYFISAAIMIVASFGIYNILNILVNQKRKDIGILRSIGYDADDILHLFLVQGVILGVLGGLLGMLVGFVLSSLFSNIEVQGMSAQMGVSYSPQIYILGFSIASLSAIFSSALPARAASRLQPIDVVRSGE